MEEPEIFLGQRKVSDGMRESLTGLMRLLQCPLCEKLFDRPTTLASCAHSFCVACIDSYCCDSWVCPVEDCKMPMSIIGGHRGSYRKVNPQLLQTVESVKIICQNLNRAPDDWWKSESVVNLVEKAASDPPAGAENHISGMMLRPPRFEDEGESSESDEEKMIDLQRYQTASPIPSSDSNADESDEWDE